MKIKILLMIATVLCILNMNTIYAAENNTDENNGSSEKTFAYIEADYSDNITPLEGDIFEITYCVHGDSSMENTAIITVDASKICNNMTTINMPAGTYDIRRITYIGTNKGRLSYGVKGCFNASSGGTNPIVLTVGYKTTKTADDKWSEYIGVGLITDDYFMSAVNENPNITMEELESEIIDTETKENESNFNNMPNTEQLPVQNDEDVYEDFYGEDYGMEVQGNTDKEPEIEVYVTTEEQHPENTAGQSQNLGKIIILCLVFIILAVCCAFVLKNKKDL